MALTASRNAVSSDSETEGDESPAGSEPGSSPVAGDPSRRARRESETTSRTEFRPFFIMSCLVPGLSPLRGHPTSPGDHRIEAWVERDNQVKSRNHLW